MQKTTIAIIDVIGLAYDGNTLNKRGLGGSESAVILLSKELSKIGFKVTVYNNCDDSDCSAGFYDGVEYININNISPRHYDIIVSSRTFIPFVPEHLYSLFQPDQYGRMHNCESFKKLTTDYKIMWMHDTFCMGDIYLEDLVRDGTIDELFTLSDFHTTYITNNDHGRKRVYEVLKDKMFQTRNGVVNYIPEVDISQKDRNHFVFNASISKGMIPLVTKVWPRIKSHIPNARLTVIGGYYRFRENAEPDEQEKLFHKLIQDEHNAITFTGIISQKEIASIYANASMFLYPSAFPETFGISTLESVLYNTPLVGCRFGAMGETAIEQASYMIDYAIEPTPLSGWISTDYQVDAFVRMTLDAYHNTYLHQQKMYYCNIVKDIAGWDSVALQWKQHLYKKMKKHLPVDDFRKVSNINAKVHEIFGRKISNAVEWGTPKQSVEKPFLFVVPVRNGENYIRQCILSIASQDYENYRAIVIDDNSSDSTSFIAAETVSRLPERISQKFTVVNNSVRCGALRNQYDAITACKNPETIIVLLDGDDSLEYDNKILDFYNELHDRADFTYGSCYSLADNIPLIAQPYPKAVREDRSYRQHKFNWGMPYTHLRTFKKFLFDGITEADCQDDNGKWFKSGGDNVTFYNVIENADPDRIAAVAKITCIYNDVNPTNDYKVNGEEQNKNASIIQNKKKNTKPKEKMTGNKKILIAIPTNKYIEPETFKSIYDLIIPEGYTADFQYFYGYRVDQVRNLIADWVVRGYDYLFSVDSDVSFPRDTLVRLLAHDKDLVSGVYRQKTDNQVLEIFVDGPTGGQVHTNSISQFDGLSEIAACGFGCVLIKQEIFKEIGYPQFEYHVALDHKNTVSEDADFCIKARNKGFKLYVDPTILCGHHGAKVYNVER